MQDMVILDRKYQVRRLSYQIAQVKKVIRKPTYFWRWFGLKPLLEMDSSPWGLL